VGPSQQQTGALVGLQALHLHKRKDPMAEEERRSLPVGYFENAFQRGCLGRARAAEGATWGYNSTVSIVTWDDLKEVERRLNRTLSHNAFPQRGA